MTTYYMNDSTEWEPIVVHNDKPSEYQDLIDDYLAGGGLFVLRARQVELWTLASISPAWTQRSPLVLMVGTVTLT